MDSGLRFRKADINDIDDIDRIYERTHDVEEAGLTTTGWVRGIYPVREVAEGSIGRDDMYVAEYDGKSATLSIDTTGKLQAGKNSLRVEVADGCGNLTRRTFTLTR